jgi:hypothetical protein
LILIFAALILGLVVGRYLPLPPRTSALAGQISTGALLLLLLTMGIRIGADPSTMANIPRLGSRAMLFAMGAVAGSIFAVKGGTDLYKRTRRQGGRS